MLYLATRSFLVDLDKEDVKDFLKDFIRYLNDNHPALIDELREKTVFTDATASTLNAAVEEFRKTWKPEDEDYGTAF